jgi:dihydrofolate reductase
MTAPARAPDGGAAPRLAMIVATDLDGVIGRDNQLPWHLPADLQRFKRLTMGKPMIMGRRTYESIGKPLPGRTGIVLTTQPGFSAPGYLVAHSPAAALELAALAAAASRAERQAAVPGETGEPQGDEIMVIGGDAVFRAFLPQVTRVYWTEVQARVTGDTRLAAFDADSWREVECETRPADDRHAFALRFRVLERAGAPTAPPTGT